MKNDYKGGYCYVNIPSLACDYIRAKRSYKRRLEAAMACGPDCKHNFLLFMDVASLHHRECSRIEMIMRGSGNLSEFRTVVTMLEQSKMPVAALRIIANSHYGKMGL